MTGSIDDPTVFYACQKCGNCCRWPGEVILEDAEIPNIAQHLQLNVHEFTEQYTQVRQNRQSLTLIEGEDGACIFLRQNRCAIHPVKPGQCQGFPNQWNFPGWRQQCEAIPIPVDASQPPSPSSHGAQR